MASRDHRWGTVGSSCLLTAQQVCKALTSPYNPQRVLDSIPLATLEFRLASREATQKVRSEYKKIRDDFVRDARQAAVDAWEEYAPRSLILKAMPANAFDVHHKHLVSLGGYNDTLVYLPRDVHDELHRRHDKTVNKVKAVLSEYVRGDRKRPMTLEQKLEHLDKVGISPQLEDRLNDIDKVSIVNGRIYIDTPWPVGSFVIPQLASLQPLLDETRRACHHSHLRAA